jgi:aminoglycoside phosphotransferase (APT) family kinase protein
MPRTLVHGDLTGKNLRLCFADGTPQAVVLDWETAGWGPPAADLPYAPTRFQRPPKPGKVLGWNGTVPLDLYADRASQLWSGRRHDLERLARLGNVFRAVAGTRWGAEQMRAGSGFRRLSFYIEQLPRALAALDG